MAGYLVTGGCGFIGSHLVDALQRSGHEVRVLDDLSTGHRSNVSTATEVVVGSVTDPEIVRSALADIDGVFHLAAIASIERSREDWRGTHATNLTGWINVLEGVRQSRKRVPLVYASSAAVYGAADTLPLEESALTRPLTAYGADKLGCELHAHVGSVVHGIPTTGLRFFNVYGPRQDPKSPYTGVISVFCDRLRRARGIEIHGDGQQLRDFVYVGDVIRFLTRAMEVPPHGARTLNVCTGVGTSISQLANFVGELCGVSPAIAFGAARPGDIRASIGSSKLAGDTLGIRAETSISDGLRRTLAEASSMDASGDRTRERPTIGEFDVVT